MNIYQPYEVIADTNDCLHLKESEPRERFHFLVLRVLPIFILLFTWFFLQQLGHELPLWFDFLLVAFVIGFTALLFFRSYITEIKILNGKEIFMVQKSMAGNKELTVEATGIEKIVLKRRKRKAKGAYFKLSTKTKRSYWIINIPMLYADEHHVSLIKERLNDMLQLNVEGK